MHDRILKYNTHNSTTMSVNNSHIFGLKYGKLKSTKIALDCCAFKYLKRISHLVKTAWERNSMVY